MADVSDREASVVLRVTVVAPPPGVAMQVQRGRSGLLPPSRVTRDALMFDFPVRVRERGGPSASGLLGEYVQGPPQGRFIYVTSGRRAGQGDTDWDRRAKVSLMTITAAQIKAVLKQPGAVLEARIAGTGDDGGPACASVPLMGKGWQVVTE